MNAASVRMHYGNRFAGHGATESGCMHIVAPGTAAVCQDNPDITIKVMRTF